eukprot:6701342-Pyramimonas_sp.AAC.1
MNGAKGDDHMTAKFIEELYSDDGPASDPERLQKAGSRGRGYLWLWRWRVVCDGCGCSCFVGGGVP